MKKIVLISVILITLTAGYGFAMMGGGMMGRGMMGGMWQMKKWFAGNEVSVDLSGLRPQENVWTLTQGRRIYERRCAVCHGEKGDGRGIQAYKLNTKPRDFTTGVYKFRSTPSGSLPKDEDIYTTISRGIRGTAMLPWFNLSKEDKWAVTYYIKTFSERFEEEETDTPVVIPSITASNSGLIELGQKIYEQAKCSKCHGRQGLGDGPKADELKDDWGYTIRPRDFTSESFKRGTEIQDIFLTVTTGLDGTPMASYGDTIPDKDMLSLSSYVKSLKGQHPRYLGGMMGMMSMTHDERIGMMTYHHTGMHGGMMGHRMMH